MVIKQHGPSGVSRATHGAKKRDNPFQNAVGRIANQATFSQVNEN
jgi:hypothetical protein